MITFWWIITTTFLISLISFIGVLFFFLKEKILNKILIFLVALSAGVLIGSAFLHLLPEAIGIAQALPPLEFENNLLKIFVFVILGFCFSFILEQLIKWHHHHTSHCLDCPKVQPFSYLILMSDAIHNFIDGLIVAGSFLTGTSLGLTTALAVAFHEIPQEIGDYGVLIYSGMKKAKALFLNFLSALSIVLGGIFGFFLKEKIGEHVSFLLPLAAGSFIYLAATDLIPQLRQEKNLKTAVNSFFIFLTGIILMILIKLSL